MRDKALIFSRVAKISDDIENDCACTSGSKIFFDETSHNCVEDDCACDNSDNNMLMVSTQPSIFAGEIVTTKNTKWQISPSQYQVDLDEEHTLLFSAYSTPSVLVLNKQAVEIRDAFQSPIPIDDAIKNLDYPDQQDTLNAIEQMISVGILANERQTKAKNQATTSETLTSWLHITNECNLRCDYCYVRKTSESMSEENGRKAIDAIFRSATAHAFRRVKLKYAGGESTLEFKLILTLHDYALTVAKQFGIELTGVVLSNSIGLSDAMIESLRERGIRLSISLDGVGDYHDAQRKFQNGHGSFALVERSLDRLARKDFKPSITITVSQRNAKGLPQTVEYLLARELPFTINFYRENAHSESFEDLAYHDQEIIEAMKQAFVKIENNLPKFSVLGAVIDRANLDSPHTQPCGVGSSYMVVDQKGNIAKCHMEIERKITDISVPDPLSMLKLDVLGIQNVSVDEKEGCRECEWRYWCAGGCPALTFRVTGRYDVKSPNCRIYKALFPDILRLEGLRLLKYAGKSNAISDL